jgi:hypothetical protein
LLDGDVQRRETYAADDQQRVETMEMRSQSTQISVATRLRRQQTHGLYLIWGYRSLHGNMPCESGAVRATLLLHFGRAPTDGRRTIDTGTSSL